jgi:hypothetical protein
MPSICTRADRSHDGRPPDATEMLVRLICLQALYNLSAGGSEQQLLDCMRCQRFRGVRWPLSVKVMPDSVDDGQTLDPRARKVPLLAVALLRRAAAVHGDAARHGAVQGLVSGRVVATVLADVNPHRFPPRRRRLRCAAGRSPRCHRCCLPETGVGS